MRNIQSEVVARRFESIDDMMEWLRTPEAIQSLLDEYPPELYEHNVCVSGRRPSVVARKRDCTLTYH
jgi:hypothetical protein